MNKKNKFIKKWILTLMGIAVLSGANFVLAEEGIQSSKECSHATTTREMELCSIKTASIAKAKRDAELQIIIAKWSPEQQKAFIKLRQVADEYFTIRRRNEIDLSGSIRGLNFIAAGEEFDVEFYDAIKNFEKGKLPTFSAQEFKKSDIELNKAYAKIMKTKDEVWQSQMGTLTKEGIKKTQRTWIRYRDAWVKFGAIRYPQISADSWKTWLTKQRVEEGFYWSIGQKRLIY